MIRDVDIRDISDGRFYRANDMVRADTGGCSGCSRCCYGMKDTILADPLDVMRLEKVTGKTFDMLLDGFLNLRMADGLILPCLAMTGEAADGTPLPEEEQHCVFLNTESGRCSVHAARTGFCRLYPLGRYYQGDEFVYFLQVHECDHVKTKIRVKNWIDTPDLPRYEEFIRQWHAFLNAARHAADMAGEEEEADAEHSVRRLICLVILEVFYRTAWEEEEDFYPQFEQRVREACRRIGIAAE